MDFSVLEREVLKATPHIPLEEIRQKIVIIDFWGSQCGSCIKSMPKMLALQKKYKDDVVILYATEQDSADVNQLFEKRPDFRKYALPMIRDASFLAKEFPHGGIPHVIWIGKDFRIKAITSSDVVTEKNIEMLITTNNLSLKTKDDILGIDYELPLLKNDKVPESNIVSSSILFTATDGLGYKINRMILEGNRVKFLAVNRPIASIYPFLYIDQINIPPFEVPFRLLADKDCENYLLTNNNFCYEYVNTIKDTKDQRGINKMIIKDLDRQLSIQSSIRKKELDCYWMNIPENLLLVSDSSYVQDRIDTISFFNQPTTDIANYIEYYFRPDLLIRVRDNQNSRITLHLSKEYKNFDEIQCHLRDMKIYFEPGRVMTDIIYIEKISR